MKFLLFLIWSLLSSLMLSSQTFADKDYYLIDSLVVENLSDDDKKLLDSCLTIFHKQEHDSDKINIINTIVNTSWDNDVWPKYNQWIYNFTKQKLTHPLSPIEKKSMLGLYAESLNNIGLYYSNRGEVKNALNNFKKALEISTKIRNQSVSAVCLNNIGILYYSQEDLDNALKYFKESFELRIKLGENDIASDVLNNIGFIYGKQKNYIKAKEYDEKSLALRIASNDKRGIAESLNNLGAISKREAEKMEKEGGNKDSIQAKIEASLAYFKRSILIQKEIKDINGMANTYNNIAHIYYDYNDMIQAEKYGKKALELALQNKHAINTKNSSELLARVYENKNQGMLALDMYKLFITTRDTINNIQAQKATIEQNLQYEFDKKESLVVANHEKELAIKEAEKQQQTIVIWAGAIVLILIVGFSVFIANRLKLSNKQKQLIEQKNKENELLLGEIHHRVKNNLQIISSLLSLQERSIDDVATKSAIAEGKERVKSMGLIHKMLYQNDNYSGVEMDNYGKELVSGLIDSFGMKETDIDVNLNFSHLKLDVDTAIPIGLIINELVINALKYAYKKTEAPSLSISLIEEAEHLNLEVKDNGNGKVGNLENSKAFGMKLIKSLSRQIGGTVSIQSNAGICVSIKIANYKLV